MTKKRDCICYQKYFWRDQCPLLEHKDHSFASSRFVPAVFGQTRKRALGQAWHTASLWLIAHRADIYICRPLLKIPVNPVASFSLCHVIGAREFSITCFPHGPWPCTLPLFFHSKFLARIFLLIPSKVGQATVSLAALQLLYYSFTLYLSYYRQHVKLSREIKEKDKPHQVLLKILPNCFLSR